MAPEYRAFLDLMLTFPAYKLPWLEVDSPLRAAVCDLLHKRLGNDDDPCIHCLAVDLIVHAALHPFELWESSTTGSQRGSDSIDVSPSCSAVSNMTPPQRECELGGRYRVTIGRTSRPAIRAVRNSDRRTMRPC